MGKKEWFINNYYTIVIFIGVIVLLISLYCLVYQPNLFIQSITPNCSEICQSNGLNFVYVNDVSRYKNAVCYCKDNDGKISTFVM